MGYYISVSAAEARAAIGRGVAELRVIPEVVVTEDEEHLGEVLTPRRAILLLSGGPGMEGDESSGFESHCSYGGRLGAELSSTLRRLGIKYQVDE